MENEEQKTLDPVDYFSYLKDRRNEMTQGYLEKLYNTILTEADKARKTGQNLLLRRLAYSLDVLSKEAELIEKGINTFVYREDIERYIKSVSKKVVKVIELEYFPRSIPDEVADRIAELKEVGLFDRFYVVFTDYTGEVESQVAAEDRRKDPIVFGAFEKLINNIWDIHDRFYYVADWEDEYCDLTLAKMVDAMSKDGDITRDVTKITSAEDIRAYVSALESKEKDSNRLYLNKPKKGIFQSVKTFFDKKVGK